MVRWLYRRYFWLTGNIVNIEVQNWWASKITSSWSKFHLFSSQGCFLFVAVDVTSVHNTHELLIVTMATYFLQQEGVASMWSWPYFTRPYFNVNILIDGSVDWSIDWLTGRPTDLWIAMVLINSFIKSQSAQYVKKVRWNKGNCTVRKLM